MNETNETAKRIIGANPVPGIGHSDDDFVDSAALFSSIVSRREAMPDTHIYKRETELADQRAWYRRPSIVAVGAALATVIVLGTTALVLGGGGQPAATTSGATTLPATTETAPPTTEATGHTTLTTADEPTAIAPPELIAADLVGVERITDESLNESGMRIWDMALGGPGLVAVGEVRTPADFDAVRGGFNFDAVVLVSTDGRSWDRVDDPEVFGGEGWDELHAVWSSPTGLIAQGIDAEAPYPDVVWYASLDGVDWTLVTDGDLYDAWEREYSSADTWIEFQGGGPGWVAALYSDVHGGERSANATIACIAYPSRECENPTLQEILVSSDGIDWETTTESLESLVVPEPQALPNPGPDAWDSGDSYHPWDLARDNDRVVAVRYHGLPKVGISTDGGETWLQVDPNAFGDGTVVTTIDVTQFGDYYVISGNTYLTAAVWILEWNQAD